MIQIVGYGDDNNIMARSQGRVKETFQKLKGVAEEIGLQVNIDKTKPEQFEIEPVNLSLIHI